MAETKTKSGCSDFEWEAAKQSGILTAAIGTQKQEDAIHYFAQLIIGSVGKESMDFADVFNSIGEHMNGINWTIRGLVAFPDLKGFDKQETENKLFPVEWVQQSGCGDYGFHGTILLPTTYSNGDGGVFYIQLEYAD